MGYKMDMNGESKKKKLLPAGERKFKITACREEVSKAGNEMFVFTFVDILTSQDEEVYAVSTKGKRWFLKSILAACGVEAAEDGVYDWDIPDVIDKTVAAIVNHYPDEYINRKGETVKGVKHKIEDIIETAPF